MSTEPKFLCNTVSPPILRTSSRFSLIRSEQRLVFRDISRQLASSHGGQLMVASKPGVGSTFSLLLPLAEAAASPRSAAA
jgi:light-regulated signal transduction histidine kinase (bacteriophytochrome)